MANLLRIAVRVPAMVAGLLMCFSLTSAAEEICGIDLETGRPDISLAEFLARAEFDEVKRKAAAGDPEALLELAELHMYVGGVCTDDEAGGRLILQAANGGSAEAQEQLGRFLWSTDENASEQWLVRAAEQGRTSALVFLGDMFAARAGDERTSLWHVTALEWYSKAADKDDGEGQLKVASYYLAGVGVTQDYEMGSTLLRKSANGGHLVAQYFMCSIGSQIPAMQLFIDDPEAYMWCIIAGASGSMDVDDRRNELLSKLTPHQTVDVQKRAREWKPEGND